MNNPKSKSLENFLFSVGGVVAMFLLLAGVYIISHLLAVRVDLTEEKAYTLSDGTKAILKKIDTPVQIKFYATQGQDMPPALKVYAQRVEDLLNEYQKVGGKNIQIKKYDPQPDTDAEEKAQFDGIEGQPLETGDRIYLGIAVTMLDTTERLTFLDPNRERLLEYDLTRAIANVTNPQKPVVGVLSSLPVMGSFNPMMMRMGQQGRQDPWIFISELKRDFTVKEIQTTAEAIDSDVNILLVVHPKNLSDATLYAIDQFVMRGGKLIAFLDPHSIVDAQSQQGQNPLQAATAGGSSMDKLTKAWGLEFDANKVVADAVYKSQINRGQRPEQAPAVLSLTDQAVHTNDVVTSQIDNIVFLFPGAFTGTPAEGLKQTVLVHTSPQSQQVEKMMAQFSGEQILKDFQPSGKELPLVVRLTGKFKTAFPEGKPKETTATAEGEKKDESGTSDASLKESQKETVVVLVGDTDFMYDHFAGQVQNFFGQRVFFPGNGNLNLLQNMVEQLAGDENLISVRSRATMNRPFTKVRAMQAAAEEKFRATITELEKSRDEAQRKLNELQQAKEGGQRFILSPEQQAEIEKFKETQRTVNKKLREVRKDLRREIDSMQNKLKLANILGMPLLVAFAGVVLALLKRNRTAAK